MTSAILSGEKVSPAFTSESENVFFRHVHSFANNDLESLMSDYTDSSILITHERSYHGTGEIRAFFKELMSHFPKENSEFTLDKLVADHELVFIVWHAITPSLEVSLGTDTFVIKKDKIVQQTFAGVMKFLN